MILSFPYVSIFKEKVRGNLFLLTQKDERKNFSKIIM